MLTTATAKAAAPQARAYKLADAGGLHLHVAPTGTKSWRLKYRWNGREKLLTIGRFPDVALAEARMRRDSAKAELRAGREPVAGAVDQVAPETFEGLARAWHAHAAEQWSAAHAADVLASLERDLFPALGALAAEAVTAPMLLNALRSVEQRGRVETARRLRQRMSMIFAFGIGAGILTEDPAERLGKVLRRPAPPRPQPALTSIEDCRALLAACDHLPDAGNMVDLASRFLALTAVRLAAVRGARWGEIEVVDHVAWWRVPSTRMKLARAKKGEERFDHLVPLTSAAQDVLIAAAKASGYDTPLDAPADALVFPGRAGAELGENAIGALYARAGFAGRHVPHGWRASFSTVLNEALGEEWRAAIDQALAHSPKDKVEGAYNRAARLDRRRQLFDTWAAMLTG